MLGVPLNAESWSMFSRLIINFKRSRYGSRAIMFFVALILLLITTNTLNILNSYVGRDFMSALADHNQPAFIKYSLRYLMVFAALTVAAVIYRYCEESLGLIWREFMTTELLDLYLQPPTYYRMNDELIRQTGVDHPDQRIADDVKTFAVTTLSFILMVTNGLFTVVAFSGVLWMISPWLFGAALGYALLGSVFTIILGGQLVNLNYGQLDKEAEFRSSLIQLRERAESVALLHQEERVKPRLLGLFDHLVVNYRRIVEVNRNLAFFTTGYFYLIQVIPIFLVAPMIIEGRVQFGVVTQSAMAFGMLVGAFSLIVTQFQSLSNFSAVIQRLMTLWYVMELAYSPSATSFDVVENKGDSIEFEKLTLQSESDKRILVKNLNLILPYGKNVLISSTDETARDALFKATAGIYNAGSGLIRRPPLDEILFLPDRPFLPQGSLRQALTTIKTEPTSRDELLIELLELLGIGDIIHRVGGLDVSHEWDTLLTPHEQRFVSLARIILAKPRFAVIANPIRDVPPELCPRIFELLAEHSITLIAIGKLGDRSEDDRIQNYDALLELSDEGKWGWQETLPV